MLLVLCWLAGRWWWCYGQVMTVIVVVSLCPSGDCGDYAGGVVSCGVCDGDAVVVWF